MALNGFRRIYGSHPLHLLTLVAGFALLGYVVATIKPAALWNPEHVVAVDRGVVRRRDHRPRPRVVPDLRAGRPVAARHRCPTSAGLAGARPQLRPGACPRGGADPSRFLPGIIEQGAPTFRAATGLTQDVFLGRWLLLTAAMFAISAVIYVIRLVTVDRAAPKP